MGKSFTQALPIAVCSVCVCKVTNGLVQG